MVYETEKKVERTQPRTKFTGEGVPAKKPPFVEVLQVFRSYRRVTRTRECPSAFTSGGMDTIILGPKDKLCKAYATRDLLMSTRRGERAEGSFPILYRVQT